MQDYWYIYKQIWILPAYKLLTHTEQWQRPTPPLKQHASPPQWKDIHIKSVSGRRTWQNIHSQDRKQTDFLEKAESLAISLAQKQSNSQLGLTVVIYDWDGV